MKIIECIKDFIDWYRTCAIFSKMCFTEEKYKHMKRVRCPQCKEKTLYSINELWFKEYIRSGLPVPYWDIPTSKIPSGKMIEPGGIRCVSATQIGRGCADGYSVGMRYEYKCHTCGTTWSEEVFH